MVLTVNLFDMEFAHARVAHGCDACGLLPATKIQYVRDQMKWDGITLFTDRCMTYVDQVQSRIKIAWILEPPVIRNTWYTNSNHKYLEEKFDYILTWHPDLLKSNPQKYIKYITSAVRIPESDRSVYEKPKLLSLVLSEKKDAIGHRLRHDITEKFGAHMDTYGGQYLPYPESLDAYKDYAFVIVTMNCSIDNYFTEYLTHAFVTGAIPILWGCPNIGEFFNTKGIIHFETLDDLEKILPTLTFELYESMKPYALENFEKAKGCISIDDSVADCIAHLNDFRA